MKKIKDQLSTKEKIAMCGVMLLGREVLPQAYAMCHPRTKTTAEQSLKVMLSRWYASDLAQKFREQMANEIIGRANEEGNDLTTRRGIVSELITAVRQSKGKDAVSGLQSLAKIQGLDKPDEKSLDERRKFVLPYLSDCRTCQLMKVYMETQQGK